LITSYLPKPHADGSPIQPSELPTSLPGYLIRLKPRLMLDGQVVAQGTQAVAMGSELVGQGGFSVLGDAAQQWDLNSDASHVAGQATAIGISAGGISARQLDALKDRLEQAKGLLQAGSVEGLTGDRLSGDLLTAVIWSWFAATESHSRLSQRAAGMVENPGLSYGLFHAVAQPVYSWGVVRRVEFPGVNIDIGHMRNLAWSRSNDKAQWVAYNRMRGQYMSALEHMVPAAFFIDPNWCNLPGQKANPAFEVCPQGISAMNANSTAAKQGQKIFQINNAIYMENPDIVDKKLAAHSEATKNKLRKALISGYGVTVHEAPITANRWVGSGFVIIDPATGSGAYTIEGGSNGGAFNLPSDFSLCTGFWSSLWTNFSVTNAIIPGVALPMGVTLLTGSFVVDALGGITLLKIFLNWNALVAAWAIGPAIVMAIAVSLINFILMSLVFELGILIGAAAVAAANTCRKGD